MAEVVSKIQSSKIKKIRTFSDDVANARGVLSVPAEPVTSVPTTPPIPPKSKPVITLMPPATLPKPKVPPVISAVPVPKPTPVSVPATKPVVPITVIKKPEPVAIKEMPVIKVSLTPVNNAATEAIKVDLAAIDKVSPESILATSPHRIDVMEEAEEGIESGNIITDRKKDRFNVVSASWGALKSWAAEERAQFEKDRAEKLATIPKVQPAEARKEIVAKAASQSAIAPKDDHANIVAHRPVEQIKKAPEPIVTIKSSASVPPPSWSHFRGEVPKKTAVETPKTKPVETKVIAPTKPTPDTKTTPVAIQPVPPKPIPKIEGPEKKAEPLPASPTPEVSIPSAPAPKVIVPEPLPAPEVPLPQIPPAPVIQPTIETPVATPSYAPLEEAEEPEPKAQPVRFKSPTAPAFPIVRVAAIGTLSVLLGISAALWLFGGGAETSEQIANQEEAVSLIAADQTVDVSVGNDRNDFLSRLTEVAVPTENAVSLLIPRIDLSGTSTAPPTATVLQILNLRLPGSFTRSIETINFGRYDGSSFIVLRVSSFDAGFSGLLEGELSLIADLQPLFGNPVTGTFDLSTRTDGNVNQPFFVDSTVKNHDVRILRDELQKERLVYGFVNRNIIIIATDSAGFEAVAEKIK